MLLAYPLFYKNYGIRRAQQLAYTKINEIDQFHFPRNSLYHHLPFNDHAADPDANAIFFQGYTKRFLIDYISQLDATEGNPRIRRFNLMSLIRPFLNHHREFRYIRQPYEANKDINTLILLNYGYLDKFYIYNKQLMTQYYKWKNETQTIWKKAKEVSQKSDRNQFFFFEIDHTLPSLSSLRVFENKTNAAMLRIFNTPSKLFILDIWKWISDHRRENSLLNTLELADYAKINFVFTYRGRWVVINLDQLDQWRTSSDRSKVSGVSRYDPFVIQKLFLKMLLNLVSIGETPDGTEPEDDTLQADADKSKQEENELNEAEELGIDNADVDDDEPAEAPATGIFAPEFTKKDKTSQSQKITETNLLSTNVEIVDNFVDISLDANIDNILAEIDADLHELDRLEQKRLKDRDIAITDEEDTVVVKQKDIDTAIKTTIARPLNNEEALQKNLEEYADFGIMSASDYRSIKKLIDKSLQLKDPYGSNAKLSEAKEIHAKELHIHPEDIMLSDKADIEDTSMTHSTLKTFDRQYVRHVLKKDILKAVSSVQKSGVIVEDYDIEHEESLLGNFEYHTVKLRPIDGKSSTVRFKVPKITEDGIFVSNGNKYIMRKQRTDLPIRKIKPTVVALSSYYGKTFIERSLYSRHTVQDWIAKELNLATLEDGSRIKKIYPANVYDNYFKAPYIYGAMASHFKAIVLENMTLEFDHRFRQQSFTPEVIAEIEESQHRAVICGVTKQKDPVIVTHDNQFYLYKNKQYTPLGNIFHVLGLNEQKAPLDFASVRIFSKMIPAGFILSYLLGFENLLTLIDAQYKIVEENRRFALETGEWVLKFNDRTYIFNRKQEQVTLILSGFLNYASLIKNYEINYFNSKEVYFNILEAEGMGSIYLKEVDNQKVMFIDPITEEILKELHEPLTFEGLLLKATELLLNYNHPDFQDMRHMRIRGYERIAGMIYKELAHAIRNYNSKSVRGKSQIDLNPYAVWKTLTTDSSIKLTEDINPIQNLKEYEQVTYVGEGGRNRDTLSRDTRPYHVTDRGIISEATIDSGDVGINTYLSANPRFKSVRGLADFDNLQQIPNASILSTSALLSAGSDHDSPQRVNFISIQQAHTISTIGYRQPYVQTGYEQILPYRTSSLFAYMAEDDGVVDSVTEHAIIVNYKTLGKKGVYLGRDFGKAEGSVYPHDIITQLNPGDKFEKNDPIAYNSGFFEPDFFNPKRIIFKSNFPVKTVIYDTSQTLEDASSVSKKISEKLTTSSTKIKSYTVEFKQGIRNMVKLNQVVGPDDVLFYIENETTANTDVFDASTIETLKRLSGQAPRAKINAVVDRIEVFYHGDKEDMSPSLRQLVGFSDRQFRLRDQHKLNANSQVSGRVNQDYRVAGKPLLLDTAEIKIYLTIKNKAAIGDKGVFANQMKTVISEVLDYDMHTESGEEIDAVFGFRSIAARVVLSPIIVGTTIPILKAIAKNAIELYEGK